MSWTRREFLGATTAAAALPLAAQTTASAGAPFGDDFLWGAAASAYQIEGGATADGKGVSVWDDFDRRRGVIADRQTGAVACDFYHRYADDVALMHSLGMKAFRFSLAWTRIQPTGTGAVNQPGLDFYQRLCDALLAAGIQPVPTLFHWDTPSPLEASGGWQSRDIAGRFGDYAAIVAQALGDRARWWLTINEPRSFVGGAYLEGVQAPGLKLPRKAAVAIAHNTLLAHGRAVQAIRAHAGRAVRVGLPNDFSPALPVAQADAKAARAATFATPLSHFSAGNWWIENAWWFDPAYHGAYPAEGLAALGADAPAIEAGDMELIGQRLDFLAANMYGGHRVRATPDGGAETLAWPPGYPITTFAWQVTPEILYWGPRWLHERYQLPVFITENGCATRDWVSLDGEVHDPQRVDYIARHLAYLAQAAREGTPLVGYLHWSLLDNFEWQEGYTQRFGMVYVDYPTLRRFPKDSARAYARIIASGGAALASPAPFPA